jgi:hypothetical protein
MATETQRPTLIGFFESFLQEQNIRWMLMAGMAILLSSSLVLVTSQWSDWSAEMKYGVLLAYTAAIYGAGRWAKDRLALVRTGYTLMGLTILLLPATFMIGGWILRQDGDSIDSRSIFAVVALAHLVGASYIAHDVGRRFLLASTPTYSASFLLLSAVSLIRPLLPTDEVTIWMTDLVLWGIMTVGVVKVNRHIFWLTEAHRAPRIVGFVPQALLGLIFIAQVAFSPALIGLHNLGLLVVLTSLTLLATVDTLARVFEQRTGGIARPIPPNIAIPGILSLTLAGMGLSLSAASFINGESSLSLILGLVINGIAWMRVATRYDAQRLMDAGLAALLVAIHLIPTLAPDVTHSLASAVAAALGQPDQLLLAIPIGETLVAMLLTAVYFLISGRSPRMADAVCRWMIVCYALALLLAIPAPLVWPVIGIPVAINSLLLGWQVGRPRFVLTGAIAAYMAAIGGPILFQQSLHLQITDGDIFSLLTLAMTHFGLLWLTTRPQWLHRFPDRANQNIEIGISLATTLLALLSLTLAIDLGCNPWFLLAQGVIIGTLILHTKRKNHHVWGILSILYMQVVVLFAVANSQGWYLPYLLSPEFFERIITTASLIALTTYGIHRVLQMRVGGPLRQTFTNSLSQILPLQQILLLTLGLMILTPTRLLLVGPESVRSLTDLTLLAMTLWGFDLAYQLRRPALSYVSSVAILWVAFLVGSQRGHLDIGLLVTAAVPAILLVTTAIFNRFVRSTTLTSSIARPMHHVALGSTAVLSIALSFLPTEFGTQPILIGLATLFAVTLATRQELKRDASLAVISIVLLLLPIHLSLSYSIDSLTLLLHQLVNQAPLMTLLGTLVACFWQHQHQRRGISHQQRLIALSMLVVGAISAAIAWPALFFLESLSGLDACLVMASSLLLAYRLLEDARIKQDDFRVWSSLGDLGFGLSILAFHGMIPMGSPFAPVILASSSFVFYGIARAAISTKLYSIAAHPLRLLAHLVPLGVPLLIVAQRAMGDYHALASSTGLLIAAGFGFWRGIEGRHRDDLILAAVNANLSLAIIWSRLGWNDPQLYMIPAGVTLLAFVEILRREIPTRWHDPLRYLGSLLILVSPIFRILDGSWLADFTLMLSATIVLFVAMGFRIRALLYTATAFLLGDLVAIVIRGCVDQPQFLWIAGIGLGTAVVLLAAYCERRRDQIIERIQALSAALGEWS